MDKCSSSKKGLKLNFVYCAVYVAAKRLTRNRFRDFGKVSHTVGCYYDRGWKGSGIPGFKQVCSCDRVNRTLLLSS